MTTKILGLIALVPTALIALFLVFQSNEGDLASQTESMITESKSAEMVEVIPTITPTSPPTTDKSPTPSVNIELDDKKIIGNIISFDEGSWFYSFKDSFNKEIWPNFEDFWLNIFNDVPLSDENLLQIKEKISDSPRIEIESGGSWINYPNQLFTCTDYNRACWITLGDIHKKFTKSYSKSTNISLRVIIPNQDLYPFQKLSRENMEIIKIDIVPTTCQDASNQLITEGYTKNESINMLTNPIYGIC